jgi:hypothetical protein
MTPRSVPEWRYARHAEWTGVYINTTPTIYRDFGYRERNAELTDRLYVPENLGFRFIPDKSLLPRMEEIWFEARTAYEYVFEIHTHFDERALEVRSTWKNTDARFPNFLEGWLTVSGDETRLIIEELEDGTFSATYQSVTRVTRDEVFEDTILRLRYLGIDIILEAMNEQYEEWKKEHIRRKY